MMPRRSATVTASVRSLTCSLERIFRTCIFTVSSAIESSPAISLFRFPAAMSDNTSSSRGLIGSSAICSASFFANDSLHNISLRSRFQGALYVDVAFVRTQDDNAGLRRLVFDFLDQVETA